MKIEVFVEKHVEVDVSLIEISEELGSRLAECGSDKGAMQVLNTIHGLLSCVQDRHLEKFDPSIRNHIAERLQSQADRWRVKE